MSTSNITIKVDSHLVKEGKVLAARRGTSLSRLLAEQLERLVRADQTYAAAKRRALARLSRGYDLGWKRSANRAALHDRESLR